MSIRVLKPGVQTTIQATRRSGLRHMGVPSSGPADALSMALANRLVGNAPGAAALEVTLSGMTLKFLEDASVAVTGAVALCSLNGNAMEPHRTLHAKRGDILAVGAATRGVRSYIAFSGGLEADDFLGSKSTYLPAGLGGFAGRPLAAGDQIELTGASDSADLQTPEEFQLPMLSSWMLRISHSCETGHLHDPASLLAPKFTIANRSDRMGVSLQGAEVTTDIDGDMPSAPVFPGTVQCPGDGSLFILSADAQTTGGYPRVAKVMREDLHILGQLRPGDTLSFVERSGDDAAKELREKHDYWRRWLANIEEII